MKTLTLTLLYLLAAFIATCASGETGTLYGSVHDLKSGERISGANVLVVGTTNGTSTNLDGDFEIKGISPGTYDIRVTSMGFNTKVISQTEITSGNPVRVDAGLTPISLDDAYTIEEMVVSAERILSTGYAVLAQRKQAATIGDAISAEQISRSPDGTSGDALKRVTGLSVVDNKYVFVRGVTDRYNATAINGVAVSSTDTDADKKSFSYDLIPASLLANTVVVKTATPDQPGDFTGGLVQVNTMEFPPNLVLNFGVSPSIYAGTTNTTVRASQGGGKDWTGRDDGSRALPEGLTGDEIAKALPNTWTTRDKRAPYNRSFNLSVGNRALAGLHEFGFIGALSYKSKDVSSVWKRKSSLPFIDVGGESFRYNVLWGAILNFNYRPSYAHKFSFQNNYTQAAEDKVHLAEGLGENGYIRRQTIEWDERSLFVTQLNGEHNVDLADAELEWQAYYSTSNAKEPDRKNIEYQEGASGEFAMIENYRSWSALEERGYGAEFNLTIPIERSRLKFGYHHKYRKREFDIAVYHSDQSKLHWSNWHLVLLPLDEIFLPDNYGAGKFRFLPMTQYTGAYDGRHRINAFYGMADVPFTLLGQRFRAAGGLRIEDSNQIVDGETADPLKPFTTATVNKTDMLPSANLTYAVNDITNFRLAFSHSVNRPEFREMADVKYYDFNEFQNVNGNPKLKRAFIRNYDMRLEVFPGPAEVLAISYFYKDLEDAIEIRLIPEPTRFVRTWFNSPNGKNHGYEIEVRKSLGFLTGFLNDIMITMNYTRVTSEIEYVDKKTAPDGSHIIRTLTRPMQGQSPWMMNAGVMVTAPYTGTTFNILYNKIGRRLVSVGDSRYEDVYEEPRNVVDIAITQRISAWLGAKFTVQDLTADDLVHTMGPADFSGPHSTISRSSTYGLSLSFKL